MTTPLLFAAAFICIFTQIIAGTVHAETFNCKSSTPDRGVMATANDCVLTRLYSLALLLPPSNKFLANYTNPEQQKLPKDGIYPLGQRMPITGYSGELSDLSQMSDAGFSMTGPYYHRDTAPPYWGTADSLGMSNFFHLRIDDYDGQKYWDAVLPRMKTAEGRAFMRAQIEGKINSVLSDPYLNSNIVAWYGYPEEPIYRPTTPIDEQRAYIKFVHDIIKSTDSEKRPYYVSERGDSDLDNLIPNQCHQDGSMKQNYLIQSNDYGDDDEMRVLMWQWAKDQIIAAEQNDISCPSYTGKKRAAISMLEMFRDPRDTSKRNEEWLRKIITHDIYIQLAAGIDGFALFSWTASSSSMVTKQLQERIYLEVFAKIAKSGLGKVFLWGDDRDDLLLEIISGPETVQWKKYSTWYTAPSIQMRNIQYGGNRYILLVNSSKQVVETRLSEFPAGMKILDMIPDKWYDLGTSMKSSIEPLGVRMYKIGQK